MKNFYLPLAVLFTTTLFIQCTKEEIGDKPITTNGSNNSKNELVISKKFPLRDLPQIIELLNSKTGNTIF